MGFFKGRIPEEYKDNQKVVAIYKEMTDAMDAMVLQLEQKFYEKNPMFRFFPEYVRPMIVDEVAKIFEDTRKELLQEKGKLPLDNSTD